MSVEIKPEPMNDIPIMDTQQQDEDDDEIVREIDVVLSPKLASQFHLIQFPLQHGSVPLPEAARMKPNHGLLELDQPVPPTFARPNVPDELNLPHRTHTSHAIPVSTHMALGKMEISPTTHQASVYLVPMSHISQMRPDFSHMNETVPDSAHPPEEEANKLEKKPVMFQKKESERAALARQNSYAYKKASEEAEVWRFLKVQGPGTPAYGRVAQAVSSHVPETSSAATNPTIPNRDTSASYVHSLNYNTALGYGIGSAAALEDICGDGDLTQLCAKLTSLLHRGWPVPYSVLRSVVPSSVTDHSLLTALSSCAVLVRGNVCLHSRLLSLPAPIQQARTLLLYLIQTFGHVQRFRLHHVYRHDAIVTPDVIYMLLQQVAEKCPHGWKLKLEDNVEFIQNFPEQTQLHLQYWERQGNRFARQVQEYHQASLE